MQIKKPSFCIVASTLPVGFISAQIDALRIRRIYVLSRAHALSYQSLQQQHPALEIVRVPAGLLLQSACFLFMLVRARLTATPVIFFHECCLPILDLLLWMIRPLGFYFPQVTMSGWEEIEFGQFPRRKITIFLRIFGLASHFKFYRHPGVGCGAPEYVISVKKYPDSILSKDVALVRELVAHSNVHVEGNSKKILFVTGKSMVSDDLQIGIYEDFIKIADSKGYACYIKDHPNPIYRLGLVADCAISYDPLVPSELLDRDFYLVIGVSSSSLLAFNERSISLINLMAEMTPGDRASCIDHFEKAAPGNNIKYIDSVNDFLKLL